MKTLKELFDEIIASEELQKEFCSLKLEEVEGFCEKHGCKTTIEDIKVFLAEQAEQMEETDILNQVKGGKSAHKVTEILTSIFGFGAACAIVTIFSAATGAVGSKIAEINPKDDTLLCNKSGV